MKEFNRILVANRGEIAIRVIRAIQEMGKTAVAIYCEEDELSLFRSKADEAYLIKSINTPTDTYLNKNAILELAVNKKIDAIHPGYGFLAENAEFAKMCEERGIKFIGPSADVIDLLGNKVNAKIAAEEAGVPVIKGKSVSSTDEALAAAEDIGYPVMIKAAAGGGGRGMRVCERSCDMEELFESAVREAKKAFDDGSVFLEKYIGNPRHVEVQILADEYGNMVHLYERDCSIQRRHQKIVEFTPCLSIDESTRRSICADALRLAKQVNYSNAGTVEFLLDEEGNHYFIEVNPRIQVEHTITELACGLDIVENQIYIAEGYELSSKEIGINSQDDIKFRGAAIECRITTENVKNNFMPDTGKLEVYKTGGGSGVRLDGGNGFTGAVISPYFDSLLVKASTYDSSFERARRKMVRVLKETTIEGVKTNKDFLINILEHDRFKQGKCDTTFIDKHPELFNVTLFDDREYKLLKFISERTLAMKGAAKPETEFDSQPFAPNVPRKDGLKKLLCEKGPEAVVEYVRNTGEVLFTDTTLRDAHQSLMATRMRTFDMLKAADAISKYESELFSLELWGGATFDTSYRFLYESPWTRLKELREKIPNIMFQMLFRASNAVGYTNYPDNVIRSFIKESAEYGIDVFRIFDSLNWLEQVKVSCEEVLKQNKIAEVALCYTGDILDECRKRYSLDYYVKKAKEIEAMGAHILTIKDMSGLLKPAAAYKLIKALKEEVKMPINLHTHDTSGNGVATILASCLAGVDIVDAALSSMSGLTSQPSLNAVVAALEFTQRQSSLSMDELQQLSDYFEKVRPVYSEFESGIKSGTTMVYKYEFPGGQFSNLKAQVDSFGMGHKFNEVLANYKVANELFGDIIKVTPSSKVVGDMAIFMTQNSLTKENIYEKGATLAFPDSVIDFFKGNIGQPEAGFDEKLREVVLKGSPYITERPGKLLPDADFATVKEEYKEKFGVELSDAAAISAVIYPKVYEDYIKFLQEYGDFITMRSDVFFYGLKNGEMFDYTTKEGSHKLIKLLNISETDEDGFITLSFEVDGFRREITLEDSNTLKASARKRVVHADEADDLQVGSPIPGTVIKVNVKVGDSVKKGDTLAIIEAMKMETEVLAKTDGIVSAVYIEPAQTVEARELIIKL